MTKKNIQYCSLAGSGRTMALRAQGRCGFDGITGSSASWGRRHRGLREDDGVAGPVTVWVDCVTGSGTAPDAQHHGLRENNVVVSSRTVSWASGRCRRGRWHHRLMSGKMAARKGARSWSGTTVHRLWGGLNDGTETPRRMRRWHRLCRGGRRLRGLQGNFQQEIFVA
jgi:hypothetical protein